MSTLSRGFRPDGAPGRALAAVSRPRSVDRVWQLPDLNVTRDRPAERFYDDIGTVGKGRVTPTGHHHLVTEEYLNRRAIHDDVQVELSIVESRRRTLSRLRGLIGEARSLPVEGELACGLVVVKGGGLTPRWIGEYLHGDTVRERQVGFQLDLYVGLRCG